LKAQTILCANQSFIYEKNYATYLEGNKGASGEEVALFALNYLFNLVE